MAVLAGFLLRIECSDPATPLVVLKLGNRLKM
jgi:hypothetical protein